VPPPPVPPPPEPPPLLLLLLPPAPVVVLLLEPLLVVFEPDELVDEEVDTSMSSRFPESSSPPQLIAIAATPRAPTNKPASLMAPSLHDARPRAALPIGGALRPRYPFPMTRRLGLIALLMSLGGCPPPGPVKPPPPREQPPAPEPTKPPVAETAGDVIGVSTFHEHHCIVRRSGKVACWGKNTYGQVGDGARDDTRELSAAGGVEGAAFVATGRDFSCALGRRGAVVCWGNNEDGQLGDGAGPKPGALSLEPVAVTGLSGVRQLSLGEYHACALGDDGRVRCWGNGADGQISNADARAFGTPQPVDDLSGVAEIACGASHVCARRRNGGVKCWGRNTEGQLGADVSGSRVNPVKVKGLRDAAMLASGHHHSCAVRDGGGVVCWGDNKAMQLGPEAGEDKRRKTPVALPGLGEVVQIAAGGRHSCARLRSGRVKCWGDNGRGQLDGNEGPARAEPLVVDAAEGAIDLALGAAQSCALLPKGRAVCWGASTRTIEPAPAD
jgi:alpha-tubulin suppressor-like RCC1 family protein